MAIEVFVPGTVTTAAADPGAQPGIEQLRPSINLRLLSSDAFGTLDDVAQQLGDLPINRVSRGEDKSALATRLGSESCAAIGNGR